jgi:hypothetical protein
MPTFRMTCSQGGEGAKVAAGLGADAPSRMPPVSQDVLERGALARAMDRALKAAVCCPLRRHGDCRWGYGSAESQKR